MALPMDICLGVYGACECARESFDIPHLLLRMASDSQRHLGSGGVLETTYVFKLLSWPARLGEYVCVYY